MQGLPETSFLTLARLCTGGSRTSSGWIWSLTCLSPPPGLFFFSSALCFFTSLLYLVPASLQSFFIIFWLLIWKLELCREWKFHFTEDVKILKFVFIPNGNKTPQNLKFSVKESSWKNHLELNWVSLTKSKWFHFEFLKCYKIKYKMKKIPNEIIFKRKIKIFHSKNIKKGHFSIVGTFSLNRVTIFPYAVYGTW